MTENIVRKLRGNRTQQEFADLVGVSQAAIARYEQGRTPRCEVIEKIAAATGKRIKWTIEDIEQEEGNASQTIRDRACFINCRDTSPKKQKRRNKLDELQKN